MVGLSYCKKHHQGKRTHNAALDEALKLWFYGVLPVKILEIFANTDIKHEINSKCRNHSS